MFAELKKTPIRKRMPLSDALDEHTIIMSLDTWLQNQIKARKNRVATHPLWSKERLEGYEQGLIDMALDAKNQIKKLEGQQL